MNRAPATGIHTLSMVKLRQCPCGRTARRRSGPRRPTWPRRILARQSSDMQQVEVLAGSTDSQARPARTARRARAAPGSRACRWGLLVEAGDGIELADEAAGEAVGEAARLPQRQLHAGCRRHVVGHVARFDAGHRIGLVLAVGEPGGFGVGGPLGAGIDRQPPHLLPAEIESAWIEMKRSALAARASAHPVAERDEHVVVAGHHDPVAAACLELFLQPLGEGEHDVLLDHAGAARRPDRCRHGRDRWRRAAAGRPPARAGGSGRRGGSPVSPAEGLTEASRSALRTRPRAGRAPAPGPRPYRAGTSGPAGRARPRSGTGRARPRRHGTRSPRPARRWRELDVHVAELDHRPVGDSARGSVASTARDD